MIGRIAGTILHRAMDHVLIDVRGVGYVVQVSARTASSLPPVGQACALYTDLLVREDLDPLSVDELGERIERLKAEIERTEAKRQSASAFRSEADSLFRK